MSAALDRVLTEMSLQDEVEEPFLMPDLPEYKSLERNKLSIIGRILNPDCQKVSDVVFDMPRKWQKYDRVQGIALSKEKFQFIFKYAYDLEEILEKGVQSHKDWALVTERWVEDPPEDYLQYVTAWVQIKNIPVNYYTLPAITRLGDFAGKVVVAAFDPEKPQSRDYVRVKVRLDVSKPLRRSKVVILPNGKSVIVEYYYERIPRRCFIRNRINHAQDKSPLAVKAKANQREDQRKYSPKEQMIKEPVLKETDPLFGILAEDQVGINWQTGRPRIAEEVLQEMRLYLTTENGPERIIREERVKSSVAEVQRDPLAERSILQLDPLLVHTKDVDKGKGVVFDFGLKYSKGKFEEPRCHDVKLMGIAFRSGGDQDMDWEMLQAKKVSLKDSGRLSFPASDLTVKRVCFAEASSSGTSIKRKTPRRRVPKNKRALAARGIELQENPTDIKKGLQHGVLEKRKATEGVDKGKETKQSKHASKTVVPRARPLPH